MSSTLKCPGHPDLRNAQPPRTTMAWHAKPIHLLNEAMILSDYTGDEDTENKRKSLHVQNALHLLFSGMKMGRIKRCISVMNE